MTEPKHDPEDDFSSVVINPYAVDTSFFAAEPGPAAPPEPEPRRFIDTWPFAYLVVIAGACAMFGLCCLLWGGIK